MKFAKLSALCVLILGSICYTPAFAGYNPIQFTVTSPMPSGLANGKYSIYLINRAVRMNDNNTPVTNGIYGLLPEINNLNRYIMTSTLNGEPMYVYDSDLTIILTCKNGATANYHYESLAVRNGGSVILSAPKDCA